MLTFVMAGALAWLGALGVSGLTDRSGWMSVLYALTATSVIAWRLNQRTLAGLLREPRTAEAWQVCSAAVTSAATLAVLSEVMNTRASAFELALGTVGSIVLLGTAMEVRARMGSRRAPRRVAIIGTGDEARELADLIDDHPETGLMVAGCVGDQRTADRNGLTHRWLGPLDTMLETLSVQSIDMPVIASSSFRSRQLKLITNTLLDCDFSIATSWGVTRIAPGRRRTATLSHEAIGVIEPTDRGPSTIVAKRALDVGVATTMLVLAFPIMVVAAIAIALESRGSVIFRQRRVGQDGAAFEMMKFRTMTTDAEARKSDLMEHNDRNGPLFKLADDPRVTRVGRLLRATSIDELPQLVSVLKGDMSLVGPRPALPEEVAQFDEELTGRADVRPGITGLWQVEARANPSFGAYRRLDLHYVENWSLLLDIKILIATFQMVAMGEAARVLCALIDRVAPKSQDSRAVGSAERRAAVDDRSDDGGRARIGILGSGFGALERAVRLLEAGRDVMVADSNTERVSALRSGRFIASDRRSVALLKKALDDGSLAVSSDPGPALGDCSEVFVYTATPRMASGDLQLCALRKAVTAIAPELRVGAAVYVKPNVDPDVVHVLSQALASRSDVTIDQAVSIERGAIDPAQSLGTTDEPLASVTELRSRKPAGALRLVQQYADRPIADAT